MELYQGLCKAAVLKALDIILTKLCNIEMYTIIYINNDIVLMQTILIHPAAPLEVI